jgi:hypothetical protein
VFYLSPLSPPNSDQAESLERNLQAAFESFNLVKYTPLLISGTTDEEIVNNRLQEVLKVINANHAEG